MVKQSVLPLAVLVCLVASLASAMESFISVSSLPTAMIGLWQRREYDIGGGNLCNSTFFASDYLNFKVGGNRSNVTEPFIIQYLNCKDNSRNPFAGKAFFSPNISTSACGQDMPRQYAYGVLGMYSYEVTLPVIPNSRAQAIAMLTAFLNGSVQVNVTDSFPMCLYFNRFGIGQFVAGATSPSNQAASLGLAAAVAPLDWITSTAAGSIVTCPSELPYTVVPLIPLGNFPCVDHGIDKDSCITVPDPQCTGSSNQRTPIGIGMSVGGIFLILISLGAVVVIPNALNIKNV